jgi:HEAT repeat protein
MVAKNQPKKLSKAEQFRRKMIWYLFIGLFGLLFILSISTAFKTSTTAPRPAPRSMIAIEDDAPPTPALSTNAQFSQGQNLLRSVRAEERRQGMEIVMAANAVAGRPYILERLGDPDPGNRAFASTMLATWRVPDADVPLLALLADPDAGVRQAAADAILSFSDQSTRILRGLVSPLNTHDPARLGPALSVWRALAPHDKQTGLQVIRTPLAGSNDATLSQTIAAIGAIYSPAEIAPIRSDLERIANRYSGQPSGIAASALLNPA